MKKAISSFCGVLFCLVAFLNMNAQPLCGGIPSVNLSVRDTHDRTVENASVVLIPLGIDDTGGKRFVRRPGGGSSFYIKFDRSVQGEYKLVASAEGFETAEARIKFFDCVSRTVYLISKSEKSARITGTIYDKNKIAILKSPLELIFTNEKRVRFKSISDDFGRYKIKLPFGKYKFETYHWKLRQFFICDDLTVDNKDLGFDIYLREDYEKEDSQLRHDIEDCFVNEK